LSELQVKSDSNSETTTVACVSPVCVPKTYLPHRNCKLHSRLHRILCFQYKETEQTSGWKYNMGQWPHDESPHGGGRRPPHIMLPASIFSICLRLYFLLWPRIVFSALGPYCIVFLGRLGPNINVCSSSLYVLTKYPGHPSINRSLSCSSGCNDTDRGIQVHRGGQSKHCKRHGASSIL